MTAKLNLIADQRRVFLFLVAFRWASLLPALWQLQSRPDAGPVALPPGLVLAIAIGSALLITLFHRPLNRLLLEYPLLLGTDVAFSAGLLAVSGGTASPYYLYALSPLLAGAFFFQMRGALLSVGLFTPLYLLVLAASRPISALTLNFEALFSQIASLWLMTLLFGYASQLLNRLQQAHSALSAARDDLARQNVELAAAHRQLEIIHELTVSLQAAPDVLSVQEKVLGAVTGKLGFSRAVVGLVNPMTDQLEQWQAHPAPPKPCREMPPLHLGSDGGSLVQGLINRRTPWWSNGQPLTSNEALNAWLGEGDWFILPMLLREHPIGVLLVQGGAAPGAPVDNRLAMLSPVASQAAVALGTTMLCIDRARRLAVEQERNRIARDIHDTVAQSLFGMVFTLDACIKMLPDQVTRVEQELVELRELASRVRDQVRRSIFDIWPSELTLERFKSDLRKHAAQCSRPDAFHVDFRTGGDFDGLSPAIRRGLYRITQEALANSARHAGENSARVCLRVEKDQVYLSIQDQGQGFEPEAVLDRASNRDRFGLQGIRERAQALDGECEILSLTGQGTLVLVRVPVNGRYNGR